MREMILVVMREGVAYFKRQYSMQALYKRQYIASFSTMILLWCFLVVLKLIYDRLFGG